MAQTLWTLKEAAGILRCCDTILYKLIKEKKLSVTMIGGKKLISDKELDRYITEQTEREEMRNE